MSKVVWLKPQAMKYYYLPVTRANDADFFGCHSPEPPRLSLRNLLPLLERLHGPAAVSRRTFYKCDTPRKAKHASSTLLAHAARNPIGQALVHLQHIKWL